MKTTAPIVDFNEKPFYNREQIKEILPHRDPFLFIDEIRDLGDDFIVGVKFVKEEEDYFRGHFPETNYAWCFTTRNNGTSGWSLNIKHS